MKLFQLVSFKVDPITDFTDIEIVFDIGTGEVIDKKSFQKEDLARSYVAESKRDYILVMFSNFVNHSRILSEIGGRAFFNTSLKSQCLKKCIEANQGIQELTGRQM